MTGWMARGLLFVLVWTPLWAAAQTPCAGGMAGTYPCLGVDLMGHLSNADLGSTGDVNDCWGWTDPGTGKEYALVGLFNGTAFVDITDPVAPVRIGILPTHTGNSVWRDIKVHNGHAYIVSQASGHGMQVFDLSRLDTVTSPPVTFTANGHTGIFGYAHNVVIDEQSAMAYVVGSNICSGGLAMFSLANPTAPVYVGCFSLDGYTHDAQCVVYEGADVAHHGKRICFCANEDTFTIVDVDDPTDPEMLSRTGYPLSSYTHQGWVSEDQRFYFMNDELDEAAQGHNTRTRVWDISDLDAPVLLGFHEGATAAIDHNLYTHVNLVYEANYRAGLRILDVLDPSTATLQEIAFFDTYPASNSANFDGAWSAYPYFQSGTVIVSSIEEGLFILRPNFVSRIPLRVFLEGPYDPLSGLMRDDLRQQGLLPLTEPYSTLGYDHVGGGAESTSEEVFTVSGGDAIVDWIVLELRDRDDPSLVVATRSALLQRDGDVVDVDGLGPVSFDVPLGLYHVAVRHRNHLGVMSDRLLPVGPSSRIWDLSDGSIPLFGNGAAKVLEGRSVLWSGNAVADGWLAYTGANNDRDPILVAVGGTVPTNTVPGYVGEDVNLDGVVKYTGEQNDRDRILENIGGAIPTEMRTEQLP